MPYICKSLIDLEDIRIVVSFEIVSWYRFCIGQCRIYILHNIKQQPFHLFDNHIVVRSDDMVLFIRMATCRVGK